LAILANRTAHGKLVRISFFAFKILWNSREEPGCGSFAQVRRDPVSGTLAPTQNGSDYTTNFARSEGGISRASKFAIASSSEKKM